MTSDPLWIGFDLGTQSVRALVADGDGEVLAAASRSLNTRRCDSRHEQDPEDWWQATVAACREAVGGVETVRIAGVACDSTSGTVVMLDSDHRALTPALMYDDARAADEAELVNLPSRPDTTCSATAGRTSSCTSWVSRMRCCPTWCARAAGSERSARAPLTRPVCPRAPR